jgi:hypothetical protein
MLPTNDDTNDDHRKYAIPAGVSFVTSHLLPAEITRTTTPTSRQRRAYILMLCFGRLHSVSS